MYALANNGMSDKSEDGDKKTGEKEAQANFWRVYEYVIYILIIFRRYTF